MGLFIVVLLLKIPVFMLNQNILIRIFNRHLNNPALNINDIRKLLVCKKQNTDFTAGRGFFTDFAYIR